MDQNVTTTQKPGSIPGATGPAAQNGEGCAVREFPISSRRGSRRVTKLKAILLGVVLSCTMLSGPSSAEPSAVRIDTKKNRTADGIDPVALAEIANWISRKADLPTPTEMPHISFIDDSDMAPMFASIASEHAFAGHWPTYESAPIEIMAFYDPDEQTIYLPNGWSGNSQAELSMLVHEMVHHMRALATPAIAWQAYEETLAFGLQSEWLREGGETLESALGISDLWVASFSPYYY